MAHLNIEIKARCADHAAVRAALEGLGARRVGTDHQIDTYFRVPRGRLKLREGPIELALIHYDREDISGPKASRVTLWRPVRDAGGGARELRELLARALGVLVVVEKTREIWFAGNVKIHLDEVPGLGGFVEIEAIDADGTTGREALRQQCERLMREFRIDARDLITGSYSDMLLGISAAPE